jgi:hypothetical protein
MMTAYHLLDASLLKDLDWFQSITASADAVALYQDLGEEAMGVGPWLVPTQSGAVGAAALPQAHGISTITTQASLEQLVQHLHQIRQIQTDDGQSFYLRFADTRTLSAVTQAWPAKLQAAIKGPIDEWRYTDRYQARIEFAKDVPQNLKALPQLKLAQFEGLINAGQADRIALELQDFNEADLHPVTDAQQFSHVQAAVKYIEKHGIQRHQIQIELTRQAVLTDGRALQNAHFIALVEQVRTNGEFAAITDWNESRV